MCCHRKASGASANIKAPDSFLVAATGIHGIDPHIKLFLWRNPGFAAIDPHKGLFLWRNLRFCATHPHKGLFLRRNPGFAAIDPHKGWVGWMEGILLFGNQGMISGKIAHIL